MKYLKRICIFCGSNFGNNSQYREEVKKLGKTLAAHEITLIYGGGNVGLMGELARSVLQNSGEVIGIIPKKIYENVEQLEITELHIVNNMHERKAKMYNMAGAYIALPGGIGTLEELSEIFTWYQLGLHSKPIGILNTNNFFTKLIEFLDHMVQEGFLKQEHRDMIIISDDSEDLLKKISTHKAVHVNKWIK